MTKPAITLRATKGTPLTFDELDTNFTNLDNATISLQAGTGGTTVSSDLNGTITLVAGTGISLSGNNSAKTITVTGSASVPSVTTANRDSSGGYTDTTRPDGYLVYNSDKYILQYWGHRSSDGGVNWQDVGNKRSRRPSGLNGSVTNSQIGSGNWVTGVDFFDYAITYTTWTATGDGYIQVPSGSTNYATKYTLLIQKSGSGRVGFGVQGSWQGIHIESAETGLFIYDIEYFGYGSTNYRITRV